MDEIFAWDKLLKQYRIRARKRWPFNGYRSLDAVFRSIARKWKKFTKDDRDNLSKSLAGNKGSDEFDVYMDNYND